VAFCSLIVLMALLTALEGWAVRHMNLGESSMTRCTKIRDGAFMMLGMEVGSWLGLGCAVPHSQTEVDSVRRVLP